MKTDDCIAVAGVGMGMTLIGVVDPEPVTWSIAGGVVVSCAVLMLVLRGLARWVNR